MFNAPTSSARKDAPAAPSPAPALARLLRRVGIDRAVAFTLAGRSWTAMSGFVTMLLLTHSLSKDQQGFYYTFTSILGLVIVFDLGVSYVTLQFASHERARLEWTAQGTLEGESDAKERLASILGLGLRWYGAVAAIVAVTVLPIGLFFFGRHMPPGDTFAWRLPWVWIALVTACSLILSPVLATLEGCGLVAEVAKMQVPQNILASLALWLALWRHWGLFASPLAATVGLVWVVSWLWRHKRGFLQDLIRHDRGAASIAWRTEVWPFQWKIALSWIGGYFTYYFFNPVLLAYRGPAAAGQMGLCLSVMAAISAISVAWVTTKSAPFGGLIAKREFRELDRRFFPCLWQSWSVIALGGTAFWAAAAWVHAMHLPISHRLLAPLPLAFLVATFVTNHVGFTEAIYLRAHKKEPFLVLTLLLGGLMTLSSYFLGRAFGALGMMIGAFVITLIVGLGGSTFLFIQKRREWHQDPAPADLGGSH